MAGYKGKPTADREFRFPPDLKEDKEHTNREDMLVSTQDTYDRIREELEANKERITELLSGVMAELGFEAEGIDFVVEQILEVLQSEENESIAANKVGDILESKFEVVARKLDGRAELIYSQIAMDIRDGNLLDFGCGDGKVSRHVEDNNIV